MQSEKGMPQPHLGVHLRVKLKILKAVLTVLINHSHPKTGRIGMKFTHGHFHHRHLHSWGIRPWVIQLSSLLEGNACISCTENGEREMPFHGVFLTGNSLVHLRQVSCSCRLVCPCFLELPQVNAHQALTSPSPAVAGLFTRLCSFLLNFLPGYSSCLLSLWGPVCNREEIGEEMDDKSSGS